MAAGLKAQCSIFESQLLGLKESPVKALNGNELKPVLLTRMGYCHKVINGHIGFMSGYYGRTYQDVVDGVYVQHVLPQPATPFEDMQRVWSMYSSLTTTYDSNGTWWDFTNGTQISSGWTVESFTGISSLTVNCPVASGFPTSVNPISGTSTTWGYRNMPGGYVPAGYSRQAYNNDDAYFKWCKFVTYSGGAIDPFYQCPNGMVSITYENVFAGKIDHQSVFSRCESDFFSRSFSGTWATAFSSVYYKDTYATHGGATANPATYDSSIQASGPTAASAESLSGVATTSGWAISQSGDYRGLVLYRGEAKLSDVVSNQATSVPFWIGKCFLGMAATGWFSDGSTTQYINGAWRNYFETNGPWWSRSISVISHGTLKAGEIIGLGKDHNLPFPTEKPFPLQSVNGVGIRSIFYFVVVGQDPAGWAKQYGYKFDANPPLIGAGNPNVGAGGNSGGLL